MQTKENKPSSQFQALSCGNNNAMIDRNNIFTTVPKVDVRKDSYHGDLRYIEREATPLHTKKLSLSSFLSGLLRSASSLSLYILQKVPFLHYTTTFKLPNATLLSGKYRSLDPSTSLDCLTLSFVKKILSKK